MRALGAAQIWSIQGSPFAPKLRSSATAPGRWWGPQSPVALSANLGATERPRSEREALDALASLGEDRLVTCHVDTLGDWFAQDAKVAGVGGSLHWLRHTFCTYLAQAGVSLHDIKELAGHSSIAVTEIYAHHAPGAGQAAIAKLAL